MYKEFLAAEPGTNFKDQGLKGVTYTCQLKDNLHAEYLLPRKNNADVELSEWQKRFVNLLNTQGMALKIFEDNGIYSFPVKMSVEIMENYAVECNFQRTVNFPDKNCRNNISLHVFATWMLAQDTITRNKVSYFYYIT